MDETAQVPESIYFFYGGDEYKIALETKEKQLLDAKKILLSAKQSYDKTVLENRDLKAYIENLKQHI